MLDYSHAVALMAQPKATLDCIDAFGTTDFRPDMAALAGTPTMFVHGDADQIVPAEGVGRSRATRWCRAAGWRSSRAPRTAWA